MHKVYKRITDYDGEPCNDPTWHLMAQISYCDVERLLCTGEELDQCSKLIVETKEVKRAGITCPFCLKIVKHFKAIKL